MDPTSQFFAKLRKVAATVETETNKLKSSFEHRNSEDDSGESAARGMRAYHELNCEVLDIKERIQDNVTQQKTNMDNVSRFIKDYEAKQLKISEDLNVIKAHWQKYGYQPPKQTEATNQVDGHQTEEQASPEKKEQASPEKTAPVDLLRTPRLSDFGLSGAHLKRAMAQGEKRAEVRHDEERISEEVDGHDPEEPPFEKPAPPTKLMRTPRLSDFGLSEDHFKRVMEQREWRAQVPPMPDITPPRAPRTPAPPVMALTPKRALRMDEEDLLTPPMHDFGITEHTCFNNDFTMDLRVKSFEKDKKREHSLPEPTVYPQIEVTQANEPLVFCTPEIKKDKTESCSELTSQSYPAFAPTTPELPTFQTKKSEKRPEPIKMESEDGSKMLNVSTPPRDDAAASKRSWEFNELHFGIEDMEKKVPEMPDLESNFGASLLTRSAKIQRKECAGESLVGDSLDLDGPTQEFNLRTPRTGRYYYEPSTPEMPDLSAVTQDICKMIAQTQRKTSKTPHEKENIRSDSLPSVSKQEFESLPRYLRVMTLSSLNQAVGSINLAIAKCKGNKMEFHVEELKQMINCGEKTLLIIVCLSELKRLDHVKGTRNNSVYKLKTVL
ncbi:unnamed protein product [Knipowitschia caucasica]|uniref:Spindle and kinetochore-associated protein 3 n=1 Tax=Knipowitschia caucasica TaxID=637954 RepID=A0AAV2K5R1_KNICA